MTYDELYNICKLLITDKKLNSWAIKRLDENIVKELNNFYIDSESLQETIYRIIHNIQIRPVCKICGNKIKFNGYSKGFTTYCSPKCSKKDPLVQQKMEKTCLQKYGIKNGGGSKEAQEKIKQTTLLHYGVTCSWKSDIIKEKIKSQHRKRLGVDYPMQSDIIKEKSKQTCFKKYGCEYTGQSEIKKQHSKETFLKHYGYEHNWKHPDVIKKCLENRFKNKIEINNITSSKPEQICFELLKNKFNTVIRQKRDNKKYPFYCDFYIKDIDTWIEYNGFMTHGYHPFDINNELDVKKLNELKEKDLTNKNPGHNLYHSTIIVWTQYDPLKRKIAKNNNLNYVEFWNINEVIEWLKKYE